MSNGDSKDDAIEDLREHQSTIKLINTALMAIKDLSRDTQDIERQLYLMVEDELRESRQAIDRIENTEEEPDVS